MRLGIVTQYRRHEATYIAITLANWARSRGIDVSIFSPLQRCSDISRHWDAAVRTNGRTRFTDWAQQQDKLIFMQCPSHEQVTWCRTNHIWVTIYSIWHEIDNDDQRAYKAADLVLAPTQTATNYLRSRWQLSRCLHLPLDLGQPFVLKEPRRQAKQRSLLLPLFDGVARRFEMTVLEVVARLLETFDDIRFAAAYTSSTLAPHAYSKLRQLSLRYRGRVDLLPRVDFNERPLLFQRHDLTLWPTVAESTGYWGLMSMCQGTPVACFQYTPVSEFVNENNSISLPCRQGFTDMGVPVADPDYSKWEDHLHAALKTPELLRMLQQSVHCGLDQRRATFQETLQRAIVD